MIPSLSITHNSDELERYLGYNEEVEHPVVLQVGMQQTTNDIGILTSRASKDHSDSSPHVVI